MSFVSTDRAGNIRNDQNIFGTVGVGLVKAKQIKHNDNKSSIMKTLDAHPAKSCISVIVLVVGAFYVWYCLYHKYPEIQVPTIEFINGVVKNLIYQWIL